MHVIITGGAGFVGSNVASSYLRDGHQVTILDNLSRRGTERNLAWLHTLPSANKLTFVRGDTRDVDLVRSLIHRTDARIVFHFAAQPAVTTSLENPRDDLETNLIGTFNVLESVRKIPPGKRPTLVFTSTNKVYGGLDDRATTEHATRYRFAEARLDEQGIDEKEPLDFHSPYGCSKGSADQYVRDYARIYDLSTIVFRMSCIYGPRQFGNEDQGWVAHFLIAVATGAPITIYGNGKQVRDLLYIDDLVRAFQAATEQIDTTRGQIYNIGGGPANSISIWRELQPCIERLAGRPIEPARDQWRPGDQPIYVSNVAKAMRDFGWAPRVSVDEGLTFLWTWIREHRELFPRSPGFVPVDHQSDVSLVGAGEILTDST